MPDFILYLPCLTTEFPFFAEDTENILLIMVTVIQQSNQRFSYNNRLLFNNASIMLCLACKDSSSLLRTWRSGVKHDMMAWGRPRIAQSLPQIFVYISAKGSNQMTRIAQRVGYTLKALTEEVRYSPLGTKYKVVQI